MGGVVFPAGIVILVVVAALFAEECYSFPTKLTLERKIPATHKLEINHLKERDSYRHRRILQSYSTNTSSSSSTASVGVVDFPIQGTYDPFLVGLYFTVVKLGSPPKDYYVQIDTGSDVLWVSCSSCSGCPVSSGLQIPLNFFDPQSSSTASPLSCSDPRCTAGIQSSDSLCSQSNQCAYTFQYGDGSGTTGYYVADLMHLDTVRSGSTSDNSTASVVFGCSTSVTGDLTKSDRAVDGIFGFGQQDMSVISQLASQGVTPKVFSHCLIGDDAGGGVLVLGEIVEPNIVYTPLVPSQPHYNLNLESISVSGKTLAISSSIFATSSTQGTIVDSGTTLAYLADGAYDPVINAITNAASQNAQSVNSQGNQCFIVTTSVNNIFPQVGFKFSGGASMILNAQDYFVPQNLNGATVWCIGFQKTPGQEITILGDLVLKNKIIVYDLANQQLGWANYDCSKSVNVSTTTNTGKSEYVSPGEFGSSSSPRNVPHKLISITMIVLLVHIFILGCSCLFL